MSVRKKAAYLIVERQLARMIARRIVAVRRRVGATQEEFAQATGVTRKHLADVETGRSAPSFCLIHGVLSLHELTATMVSPVPAHWLLCVGERVDYENA